jgi:peptide/nickel transport system substrate-binding protein
MLSAASRAGVGAAGLALVGCGGDDDDDDEPTVTTPPAADQAPPADEPSTPSGPRRGGTFVEGYDRDFNKMDPVLSPWADPAYVALYEFTQVRDPNGGIVPALAESWTVADDKLSWTLKIREGINFHSGAPMTAENVVEDFNIFRNPDTGQNAIFWPSVENVRLGDEPGTVVVELNVPFAALPETLATEFSMIHNERIREEAGESFGATVADGTGPFTLGNFEPGNEVVVERWDDYHGTNVPFLENTGTAYLDAVRWVPILEPSQRAAEMETGSVDAMKNPAGQDIARLKSNDDLVVVEFTELSNFILNLNQQNTALGFDDVRVRQAISHAIDRDAIVDAVYFGAAAATPGPVAAGYKWYETGVEAFNQFDPDRTATLLEQAGFVRGGGGWERDGQRLEFTVINENDVLQMQIMEAVTGMLADVDIPMQVRNMESAVFFDVVFGDPPPDAWTFKWLWSSVIDLIVFFEAFPTAEYNQHGVSADLQRAIEDWQGAGTDAELEDAARRVQLSFAEFLPWLAIVTPNNVWVNNKKVHGWQPSQTMLYPFYNDVWMDA